MLGEGPRGTPEDLIGLIKSDLDGARFANFGRNPLHFRAQLHRGGGSRQYNAGGSGGIHSRY